MHSEVFLISHSDSSLEGVLKKLQKVANISFEKATPVPLVVNLSSEFYNQEHIKYLRKNGFVLVEKIKFQMVEIN